MSIYLDMNASTPIAPEAAALIRPFLDGIGPHTVARTMSPVPAPIGGSTEVELGTIGFSLGRTTTESEIDQVVRRLAGCV